MLRNSASDDLGQGSCWKRRRCYRSNACNSHRGESFTLLIAGGFFLAGSIVHRYCLRSWPSLMVGLLTHSTGWRGSAAPECLARKNMPLPLRLQSAADCVCESATDLLAW